MRSSLPLDFLRSRGSGEGEGPFQEGAEGKAEDFTSPGFAQWGIRKDFQDVDWPTINRVGWKRLIGVRATLIRGCPLGHSRDELLPHIPKPNPGRGVTQDRGQEGAQAASMDCLALWSMGGLSKTCLEHEQETQISEQI